MHIGKCIRRVQDYNKVWDVISRPLRGMRTSLAAPMARKRDAFYETKNKKHPIIYEQLFWQEHVHWETNLRESDRGRDCLSWPLIDEHLK